MKYLIDELKIDKDLILEFVFYFSRIEYALKREKYRDGLEGKSVSANWDSFFSDHQDQIHDLCKSSRAAHFILENPPKKQTLESAGLGWQSLNFKTAPIYSRLCLALRTIRNNLFHGGKFPLAPMEDVSRDVKLIESALAVLKELSRLKRLEPYFSKDDLSI